MSNPIFDVLRPNSAPATQENMLQNIAEFAKTIQGNPEQIVRGLIDTGRMSQQQFDRYAQIAHQILPPKK